GSDSDDLAGITGPAAGGVIRVPRGGARRCATYVRGNCRPSASRAVGRPLLSKRAMPRIGEFLRPIGDACGVTAASDSERAALNSWKPRSRDLSLGSTAVTGALAGRTSMGLRGLAGSGKVASIEML